MNVDTEKERKIFYISLLIYIAGAIAFFISFISLGHTELPSPIWVMFLLLDAGFIAFLILPSPGRVLVGSRGGLKRESRWYPQSLEDIVVRRKEGEGGGIKSAGGPIEPVLVLTLVLLIGLILILSPDRSDRESWEKNETARLEKVYREASSRLTEVEEVLVETEIEARRISASTGRVEEASPERAGLIRRLDSLALEKSERLKTFSRVGIQIYSPEGERVAWGGTPNYLDARPGVSRTSETFAERTNIFTVLARKGPLKSGSIIVDAPVEVNRPMRNRFLERNGLADAIAEQRDAEIVYNYHIGTRGGGLSGKNFVPGHEEAKAFTDPGGEIGIYGKILSAEGMPLARLRVRGDNFEAVKRKKGNKRAFWAGIVLTVIVSILAVWIYRTFRKRSPEGATPAKSVLKRVAVLLFFLGLIRFILLRLRIPGSFLGAGIFDPVMFVDDMPGGLLRTGGDFLITSLFVLILVFGSIKLFRTFYPGLLERKLSGGGDFSWSRTAVKFAVFTLLLFSGTRAASKLVSRVVLNSNTRIIGLEIDFLEASVISLHISLLFSVSAIFIVLIFLCRLILLWGDGGLRENLAAGSASAVALAVLYQGSLFLFIPALALLMLSARIFPLLKKEEIITVMLSSFLLVLIFSLLIYGTASHWYERLKKNRVVEMVREFNHPEDTWIKDFLPDICADVSAARDNISKVIGRKESAAFEIWADSRLGRFDLPCVIDVFDRRGERFSSFSLGIPLEVSGKVPSAGISPETPAVVNKRAATSEGMVSYLIGVAPIYSLERWIAGRVEIKIPYFFESPRLLAVTGPTTPEIFQERRGKALGRRVDEPRDLFVAKVDSGRVVSSSEPFPIPGTRIEAGAGEWFRIETEGAAYLCVSEKERPGGGDPPGASPPDGYIAGYQITGYWGRIVEWATVVSIEIILAIFSLLVLFLIRKMPVLGSVTPDISFSRALGFKQKLLVSFFLVSMLPVAAMGLFSSRFIQDRYRAEATREAGAGVESAASMIRHSIISEAESFAGSQYLNDILRGDETPRIRDVSREEIANFTLFTRSGILLDESLSDFSLEDLAGLLKEGTPGEVTLSYSPPHIFGGLVIPVSLPGGVGGFLYYRRRINDGFIQGVARVLGKNLDVYYGGELAATSQRELFTGGFLNPLLDPAVFADVALEGGRIMVGERSLGEYSYHVASVPISPFGGGASGVLSVPLLYRTALVQKEIHRAFGFLLGLLALLFAAALSLGVFLAGKIFTPIAQLRKGTRRIMEGDLGFRLEAEAPDEIGELVDSFNSMTTALGEARDELLERQRYLATVLDNIATGVISSDSDGRIVTLNPAGENILGINLEEIAGARPAEIEKRGLEDFFELFSLGEVRGEEREITMVSGKTRRTIKAVVTSVYKGGDSLGTVVVFDDLTELIRSKKLSAWVEMARQIAHEVKNPLTPIKLSAQFMRRAYGKGDRDFEEIFNSGIDTIMRHTDILRRIASEFSSFGRVSELKIEKLNLNEFVKEQIASYRGIEKVEVDFVSGGAIEVKADSEGLRKMFNNLMENAIESITGRGKITVEISDDGERACLKVIDTGSGLSREVLERLFEPYFSTKTTGTGLGLAICKNLVDQMGGEMILQNREDSPGAEAVVTLPLA